MWDYNRTYLDYLGLSGTIWDYDIPTYKMEVSMNYIWIIWDYMGLSGLYGVYAFP